MYFEVGLFQSEDLLAPRVGLSFGSIDSFLFERLVKAVENASEKDFGELFEVGDSLFFFLGVGPFRIKVDELVGIVPMLVE